jgi:acyl-coenzyme A synthetase/AMP-(fatty) acid ligase
MIQMRRDGVGASTEVNIVRLVEDFTKKLKGKIIRRRLRREVKRLTARAISIL